MLAKTELVAVLEAFSKVRIGVIGDFCLDAYWEMDHSASESSIETGLTTRPVKSQRYELGGAGTIINNLVSLGVGRVEAFGVAGNDLFGHHLVRILDSKGVHRSGLETLFNLWQTPVYIKPIRDGHEESRIDIGGFNQLDDEIGIGLVNRLESKLRSLDAVIINQQFTNGIHIPIVQKRLNAMFEAYPDTLFIADVRLAPEAYSHCIHKLNNLEAARICGSDCDRLDQAAHLYDIWQKPVFVTRGDQGCLVVTSTTREVVPALRITGPVDPVGAGDSFLAGMTAALAAGSSPEIAAELGNLVAAVTVQKLHETGTASPAELLALV